MLTAPTLAEGVHLSVPRPVAGQPVSVVIHDNSANRSGFYAGDDPFEFLPYQLSMVG